MFNSPENLQRIAELMSKADSGHSVEEIMEEIRKSTGLDANAFWAEIGKLGKTANENPFAKADDKGESDDKDEEKGEEKDDAESEDKGEDKSEGEDKGEEKAAPKKEEKESDEDEDEEEPGTPEWEKKDMKLAKDALKKLKELVKREKKEREGAEVEQLEHAMDIIEKLMKGEADEAAAGGHDVPSPEGEEVSLEKTGPDLPPAMEGMALPLPEPSMEKADGMKVIDLAPPAMPLMAGADEKLSAESKKKLPPGFKPFPKKDDKGEKCDDKNPFAKKDEKKSGFSLRDRVWRKADFNSGFETVGDEPGRVVDFGNDKVIVDWGHEDGIPTEENPADLMLATAAAELEHSMFSAPAPAPVEEAEDQGSPMGQAEALDQVLRETSLYDILRKQADADKREADTVTHIASGKTAKILQRLASGQLRVAVDGKELTLWSYEVESN